ncbi:MAG: hypothetical protein GWN84_21970 [Gammaproteobacteria bacterium]|nr:hypothetical protein [Gammaproteobacteria bacterium]NIR88837.1 hypothetical protein [Gammaproteobacteria bacterium]NIU06441.1 hypothetical protein [Gammaproteobacteria bacterium]NIV53333.1 hypothetical protein [Gammaproteobacteria bacterium]NIV74052.1 hypothetical protein [Gammaproteobacteria bacterium]
MINQLWRTAILYGLVALAPLGAWACGAAGPNTHVGPVVSFDAEEGTFTILDAETQKPVTFRSDTPTVLTLSGAKGPVMVHYEKTEGSALRAIEVRY